MTTRYTVARTHKTIAGASLSPEFAKKADAQEWIAADKLTFSASLEENSTVQDTRSGVQMLADYDYEITSQSWA